MTHLQKLKASSLLKWVSSNSTENLFESSKTLFYFNTESSFYIAKTIKFYTTKPVSVEETEFYEERSTMPPDCKPVTRISRSGRIRIQAQAALLEYLYCTRSLQFVDADHMSKNSPKFLEKLLEKVENDQEVGKSLTRFFHYHPINEFEPFFESLGLNPYELELLLPRDLLFLCDDDVLLKNYQVLCNYGIYRSKIGKIFKEAREIFRYGHGVLSSKLLAYEELGLTKASVVKVVAACPSLLVGDVNEEFVEVLDELKSFGIDYNWIERRLSEKNSYRWSQMLGLLKFFSEMGYNKEKLGEFIRKHPGLILDGLGKKVFSLIGLLLKLGFTINEISSLFAQFPQVHVGTFVKNLNQSFLFLVEIEMEAEEIMRVVRAHPILLGSCSLKKPNTVLAKLHIGKRQLCEIIKENPHQLKNWILGLRIDALPNLRERQRSLVHRTEFLLKLGFVEDSNEMKKAFKVFRGKGGKLQERFDCFVRAGLDRKDVSEMIKVAPQVLNQSREVIEKKIDFLVNGLGFPVSNLVAFPGYTSYTIQRVKLRYSMYSWLKDEGAVAPTLALSTILACSDKIFIRQFVRHHPRGHEVWQKLKKAYSLYGQSWHTFHTPFR